MHHTPSRCARGTASLAALLPLSVWLAALPAALVGSGCSRSPTLLVTVEGVPPEARSLSAMAVREGEPGMLSGPMEELHPYDLPQPASGTLSFVLRVPLEADTPLILSVAAFSQTGAGGCLLRAGHAAHTFQPSLLDDSVTVQLSQAGGDTGCASGLRVTSAAPRALHAAGGDKLIIQGWGFRPGSTVILGDKTLPATYRSAYQLEVAVPPATRIGAIPLTVQAPDGQQKGYSGLRYVVDAVSFAPLDPFPLTTGAIHPAVGDLDGDGRPDLVMNALSQNSNEIILAFQKAPLTFTVVRLPVQARQSAVRLVDVDGDKDLDLLFTTRVVERKIHVGLNDGRGSFNFAAASVPLGFDPFEMITPDLDGDGDADLAILSLTGPTLYTLYNDGRGVFGAPQATAVRKIKGPFVLDSVDYNLDGKPDLVLDFTDINTTSFGFGVLQNPGAPFPADDSAATLVTLTDAADSLFSGDLDADGKLDLIVPSAIEPMRAYLSAGGPPRKVLNISAGCLRNKADTTDLTGDGLPDLLYSCSGERKVEFLLQLVGQSFAASMSAPAVTIPQTAMMASADEVRAADLDGDNRPELIVSTAYELWILRNTSR